MGISNFLLDKSDGTQLILPPVFRLALNLGRRVEKFASVEPKPEIQKLLEEHYSRSAGKKQVTKRWDPYHKLMNKALKMADSLWEKGDKAWHSEMANYLVA